MNRKIMTGMAVLPLVALAIFAGGGYRAGGGVPSDLRDAVGDTGAIGELGGLSSEKGEVDAAAVPKPVAAIGAVAAAAAKEMEAELFEDEVFQALVLEKGRVESAMKACDLSGSSISEEKNAPLTGMYIKAAARTSAWVDATRFRLAARVELPNGAELNALASENDRVVSYIEERTKRSFPDSSLAKLSPEPVAEWMKKLRTAYDLSDDEGKKRIKDTLGSVNFRLLHKLLAGK